MKSNLELFLEDPYGFIENSSVKDLVEISKQADISYYNNDEPIISDQEYDLIRDRIIELDPSNPYLSKPAHQQVKLTNTITNKEKISLPYTMGSMNKFKPENSDQIVQFGNKYSAPWIVSDKLDGVSALYIVDPDGTKTLYTRGDGFIGTIISNLIPIINIPKPKVKSRIVVRGELIISKKAFEKHSSIMANARNMVAGIVNAKTVDKSKAQDIDFVAYEMIEPWDSYTNQFEKLSKLKFNVVHHTKTSDLSITILSTILSDRKKSSPYECDGIIIAFDSPSTRVPSGNPDYAFAFKNLAELETAIVKVIKVEWNVSKDKYLKPKLIINPTKLSGVTISNVTAFNAKYIVDNCLGPGAEIKLVRSGDVIPHILEVTKKATGSIPQLPPEDTYEWNATSVDIIALDGSKQHLVKELTYFCSKLDIANLSEGNISKMIDAGIDSIPAILSVTKEELGQVEGFKDKMIDKIYTQIHTRVNEATLIEYMVGSNKFGHGMGERKIKKILDEIPDIIYQYIEKKDAQLINQIIQLEGFDKITATQFIKGMGNFLKLLNEIPDSIQHRLLLEVQEEDVGSKTTSGKMQGLKVVFSGFRDKEWEKKIVSLGGEVSTSVSKNTKILVTTAEDIVAKTNAKVLKAFELGVQLMSKEEFETKYIK